MKSRIWLSSPHLGGNELKYIVQSFQDNWIAPLGPNVDALESDLNEYLGKGHAVALSSGTAAIHLAMILAGVQKGNEVYTSTLTFSATINPIIYLDAKPVFIDSESGTWNMDPYLLEQALREGLKNNRKPAAVICVDIYGMPAKLDRIGELCLEYEIPMIEDAAEALGGRYKDKKLGTYGDFGILSFNGNKIITTSGGGALVCKTAEIAQKTRFLATQARDPAPHYQHSEIGYNYRMSNILAGIGRGQLEVLDLRVQQRRKINAFYHELFDGIEGITFLEEPDNNFYSNYWLTTIIVDPDRTKGISREDLRLAFEKDNIEARPIWKPMHIQPVFREYHCYNQHVAERIFERGLCLPSGSNLTNEEKQRITKVILDTFNL
jgi:dTDP-4-amino-4,6-dideoxygalactose transaminase